MRGIKKRVWCFGPESHWPWASSSTWVCPEEMFLGTRMGEGWNKGDLWGGEGRGGERRLLRENYTHPTEKNRNIFQRKLDK